MITALYSIIFVLSLAYPVGYYLVVRKQQNEPWLFGLNLSVCVVTLGYLLLSLSKTVEFALFANKIAYLGQVFVPLCMFMISAGLSGFTYKKSTKYVLIGAAVVVAQCFFCRWWLKSHSHGPFETLWRKLTWIDQKK